MDETINTTSHIPLRIIDPKGVKITGCKTCAERNLNVNMIAEINADNPCSSYADISE
ncbi:hypothetical protein HHI36_013336, partial [Cryptolaemus montrouzieri]